MADDVIKGTKIDAAEAKTLDPAKMCVALTAEPDSDVEGQALVRRITQCPWCDNLGWSVVDTDYYNWYTCGRCGGPFKA